MYYLNQKLFFLSYFPLNCSNRSSLRNINDVIFYNPFYIYWNFPNIINFIHTFKYKIYIIADADMMTVQAQNALLKTIEEPPAYAVIMLLTENAEVLLPTIRSRCVMMKLRNIKDQLVKKYLMEQLEVPDYKADVCVAFAQGNMGKAIMLAHSEYFNEIKEEAVHLLRNIDID